jgi:hypothetical protein
MAGDTLAPKMDTTALLAGDVPPGRRSCLVSTKPRHECVEVAGLLPDVSAPDARVVALDRTSTPSSTPPAALIDWSTMRAMSRPKSLGNVQSPSAERTGQPVGVLVPEAALLAGAERLRADT